MAVPALAWTDRTDPFFSGVGGYFESYTPEKGRCVHSVHYVPSGLHETGPWKLRRSPNLPRFPFFLARR